MEFSLCCLGIDFCVHMLSLSLETIVEDGSVDNSFCAEVNYSAFAECYSYFEVKIGLDDGHSVGLDIQFFFESDDPESTPSVTPSNIPTPSNTPTSTSNTQTPTSSTTRSPPTVIIGPPVDPLGNITVTPSASNTLSISTTKTATATLSQTPSNTPTSIV